MTTIGTRGPGPRKLVSMLPRPGTGPGDDRPCLLEGGRGWTRGQLRGEVAHCVRRLREHGIGGGDRVLALLDHDARGVFFLAAASALGLRVIMPYNLQAAATAEWRSIAVAARPDVIVHLKRDRSGAGALRGLGPRLVELDLTGSRPDDVPDADHAPPVANFLTLFTSGTTGAPKAISVSEELVCRRVASVSGRLSFDAGARVFMSGLLNNTTGVIFSFGALLHDAVLVLPDGRDVTRWPAQVAGHRATHVMLRPVAMKRFVDAAATGRADLSSLRVVAYGAAAMPRAVLEEGRRLMPCDWVQGYGLSETYGPFCWLDETAHRERRYRAHAYCVGRPDETLEVRLEPLEGHPPGVGEIVLRGDALMEGYYDVAADRIVPTGGWLRTGDVGAWSPDGDLLLKGRLHGSVLTENGHRVYPEEVEAVLAEVDGVDEVVLVGVTRAAAGAETAGAEPAGTEPSGAEPAGAQRPVACIAGPLSGRGPAAVRAALTDALARVLSREKWPDLVFASPAPFPKSGNDKVLRAEVAMRIDPVALIEL